MKFFDIKYIFAVFVSACLITTLTRANPPPVTIAQPVEVKVIDPVTVTGKVDIGNKLEISGTVQTLNDALKIPFRRTVEATSSKGLSVIFYTVPAGMRLTIESVSAGIFVPSGQKVLATLSFSGGVPGSSTQNYLPLQPQGSFLFGVDYDIFVSSQNLKIIVDSTSPQINYTIYRNSNDGEVDYSLTVNGYLEAMP